MLRPFFSSINLWLARNNLHDARVLLEDMHALQGLGILGDEQVKLATKSARRALENYLIATACKKQPPVDDPLAEL